MTHCEVLHVHSMLHPHRVLCLLYGIWYMAVVVRSGDGVVMRSGDEQYSDRKSGRGDEECGYFLFIKQWHKCTNASHHNIVTIH